MQKRNKAYGYDWQSIKDLVLPEEKAITLMSCKVGGVLMTVGEEVVTYSEKRFCEWYEDKKGVTLRASSGSYGGGSEVLVCTREQSERCAKRTTNGFSNNKLNKGN